MRQHARRPRGLLGVARFREARRVGVYGPRRPGPQLALPLPEALILPFLTLLRPKPSLPSIANPSRPHASPWPTEEQVRVRIAASHITKLCHCTTRCIDSKVHTQLRRPTQAPSLPFLSLPSPPPSLPSLPSPFLFPWPPTFPPCPLPPPPVPSPLSRIPSTPRNARM